MSSDLPLETLKAALKGDLLTPSEAEYEAALKRWARNAERRAKVVAFVKDAVDVSTALALTYFLQKMRTGYATYVTYVLVSALLRR